MSIRVSVSPSILEEWRVCKAGLYNKTADDLIKTILTPEFVKSEAMARGTVFHHYLEHDLDFEHHKVVGTDGFMIQITEEVVHAQKEYLKRFQPLIFESWAKLEIKVDKFHVQMNMRLDAIEFPEIVEFKTTSRPKKYMDYYESMQWRCYLLASPEATKVDYHVFNLGSDMNNIARFSVDNFTMNRYNELEHDVINELAEFLTWCEYTPALLEKLESKVKP